VKFSGKCFLGTQRSCVPEIAKVVSNAAAETWYCERSWKAIGEGIASAFVDGPGLKRSCKGFEA
jgi:hypothetical protein